MTSTCSHREYNKMKKILRSTALLFVVFSFRSLEAQESVASYTCDAKAGTFVIRYSPDGSEGDPSWPESSHIVIFGSLLDLNEDETAITGLRSRTISCRLKSDRFRVVFEPSVMNFNLLGRCGAAWTGTVTVTRNGKVVLNEKEFEDLDCHERERMLERIAFRDGVQEPELTYVGYE